MLRKDVFDRVRKVLRSEGFGDLFQEDLYLGRDLTEEENRIFWAYRHRVSHLGDDGKTWIPDVDREKAEETLKRIEEECEKKKKQEAEDPIPYYEPYSGEYRLLYRSSTIRFVTGVEGSARKGGDDFHPDYDRLNALAKLLYLSEDKDLQRVFWNSVAMDIQGDTSGKFMLQDKVERAFASGGGSLLANCTADFDTERLTIAPLVPGPNILGYIGAMGDEDGRRKFLTVNRTPDNYIFLDWKYDDPHCLGFTVFLKGTDEVVAGIALYTYQGEEGVVHLQCYTRRKYRDETYVREAIEGLLQRLKRERVYRYGELFRERVREVERPVFHTLRIDVSERNLDMRKVALDLGFTFLGSRRHEPEFEGDVDHLLVYSTEIETDRRDWVMTREEMEEIMERTYDYDGE